MIENPLTEQFVGRYLKQVPMIKAIAKLALALLSLSVLLVSSYAQSSARYRQLKKVVNANAGFSHATRGMNMYTLIALRSCVSTNDIAVLGQMLTDSDSIVRMTSAYVLVDLGAKGEQVVRERLDKGADTSERTILREAINDAASPEHRPILQYPLTDSERSLIRGCTANPY